MIILLYIGFPPFFSGGSNKIIIEVLLNSFHLFLHLKLLMELFLHKMLLYYHFVSLSPKALIDFKWIVYSFPGNKFFKVHSIPVVVIVFSIMEFK